jgi:hypothetical protein
VWEREEKKDNEEVNQIMKKKTSASPTSVSWVAVDQSPLTLNLWVLCPNLTDASWNSG